MASFSGQNFVVFFNSLLYLSATFSLVTWFLYEMFSKTHRHADV